LDKVAYVLSVSKSIRAFLAKNTTNNQVTKLKFFCSDGRKIKKVKLKAKRFLEEIAFLLY
jgi:hypothetical protein